ncbi:hypothetical protein RIF29_28497 [Crotalaria pallida]|uniref:Uncharacterized protein n=1 Tax=Crotalaria pallida TaxID=3830 RepID=A0AAN9EDS5_CROPI
MSALSLALEDGVRGSHSGWSLWAYEPGRSGSCGNKNGVRHRLPLVLHESTFGLVMTVATIAQGYWRALLWLRRALLFNYSYLGSNARAALNFGFISQFQKWNAGRLILLAHLFSPPMFMNSLSFT